MPKPCPREFRDDVVRVARNRDSKTALEQIAKDFGIHQTTLNTWIRQADVQDGVKPGVTAEQSEELRELKRRNRLLEQEVEGRLHRGDPVPDPEYGSGRQHSVGEDVDQHVGYPSIVQVARNARSGVASSVVNMWSRAVWNSSWRANGMLIGSNPCDMSSPTIIRRAVRLLPSK